MVDLRVLRELFLRRRREAENYYEWRGSLRSSNGQGRQTQLGGSVGAVVLRAAERCASMDLRACRSLQQHGAGCK